MRAITITLPHPPSPLSPNAKRGHWSQVSRARKSYRAVSKYHALVASQSARPMWKKARVFLVWHSITARHPDPDNIGAMMKAAYDGLQDAGVIENDRTLWPERPQILLNQPWPQVVLRIEEETE